MFVQGSLKNIPYRITLVVKRTLLYIYKIYIHTILYIQNCKIENYFTVSSNENVSTDYRVKSIFVVKL